MDGRYGRPAVDAIMTDSSLSHSARSSALQQARENLEAKLRANGMFRLEVLSHVSLRALSSYDTADLVLETLPIWCNLDVESTSLCMLGNSTSS